MSKNNIVDKSYKTDYPYFNNIDDWFTRLNFADPNKIFIDNFFDKSISFILPDNSEYAIDSKNTLSCAKNYYYNNDNCSLLCSSGFNPGIGSASESVALTYGYCNQPCGVITGINCGNATNFKSNYTKEFSCQEGYIKFDLNCYLKENADKGALQYSSEFNPPSLDIKINKIENYYLEVWYFNDKVFIPKSTKNKNWFYIWKTTGISIKKGNNFKIDNNYQIEDPNGKLLMNPKQNLQISYGQWYKIAYYINRENKIYNVTYIINGGRENFNFIVTSADLSLRKISFCSENNLCFFGNDTTWFNGYYKKLAIFNISNLKSSFITNLYQQ